MCIPATLRELIGEWAGVNRLWLSPKEPARHSETTASVALAAQGRFATIKYTWADEGQPQDGLLTLGADPQRKTLEAVWIDSWHNFEPSTVNVWSSAWVAYHPGRRPTCWKRCRRCLRNSHAG
jgi:hypothetical protein